MYIATMRVTVSSPRFHTAGQEKFGGYAAIAMFNVKVRVTYKLVLHWHNDLVRVYSNIPIVLVGNKIDCKDRKGNTSTHTQ